MTNWEIAARLLPLIPESQLQRVIDFMQAIVDGTYTAEDEAIRKLLADIDRELGEFARL